MRCRQIMISASVLGALLLGSGCSIQPWVKPYERDRLADPIMAWDRDAISNAYLDHIRESREGSRGGRNKPRREREPRRAGGGGRGPKPQPEAPVEAFTPPTPAPASRVPSIGRAEPRRTQREPDAEPADHSHLPAFLLRPVRARV